MTRKAFDAAELAMAALIYALIGAALTGLAVIAFQRPLIFARLYPNLNWVSLIVVVVLSIWTVGGTAAFSAVYEFIDLEKRPAARAASESAGVPFLWTMGVYWAFSIYLWVLKWLSEQVLLDKKPSDPT